MKFNPTGSTAAQFCSAASDKEHHLMTRIRNRAALLALPLALGTLAVGASSASADSTDWGDNGSGVCNVVQSSWTPSQAGAELGTYCMQSVTGWIQINGGATQTQTISCDNNAPGGSPGLSWSLDGQAYVNAGPWNMLGYNLNKNTAGGGGATNNVGWQTSGDANLTGGDYTGYDDDGSDQANGGAYGYGGATVTNWGGSGNWQAAIACVNQAGISAGSSSIAPVRFRDKTMDTVNKAKGRGFLVREFALKKNVTRTSTRSCPAGMVRRGNLSYTVQEFPADHKSPKWKDRALVDVKMTPKGNNAGSVKMTLKRAKSPTVVQFQMRCGKR